jgi:hypothetical protein
VRCVALGVALAFNLKARRGCLTLRAMMTAGTRKQLTVFETVCCRNVPTIPTNIMADHVAPCQIHNAANSDLIGYLQ